MHYCSSLYYPTESKLKSALSAIINRTEEYKNSKEAKAVDQYCREYYECDIVRKYHLNRTSDVANSFVRDCKCEKILHEYVVLFNSRDNLS